MKTRATQPDMLVQEPHDAKSPEVVHEAGHFTPVVLVKKGRRVSLLLLLTIGSSP